MARTPWRWRCLGPGLLLCLGGLVGGCSGTPFGEQLSGSFSSAPATPSAGPAGSAPAAPAPAAPDAAAPAAAQPERAKPPPAPVLSPAPYRITIKLSGADPAAPAEAVTQALRAAGVPFEVEMIERMPSPGSASAAPAPALTPAAPTPAAPAAAAPSATTAPAPAPR
ncbi:MULTISPECIES: hypothetical protein [Aphanothece]|uniref:hypothetical protein n=1 Tax=Aphanothece TaxID=1121 RepID=UPI00398E7FC7